MKKLSSRLSAHARLLRSCGVEIRSGNNPSSCDSATSYEHLAVGESSFQRGDALWVLRRNKAMEY